VKKNGLGGMISGGWGKRGPATVNAKNGRGGAEVLLEVAPILSGRPWVWTRETED